MRFLHKTREQMVKRGTSIPQKIVSERLRKAREDAGMSQAQVAIALEKPQWFVSRCETGGRRLSVIELIEFARIYQIDLGQFLNDLNQNKVSKGSQ